MTEQNIGKLRTKISKEEQKKGILRALYEEGSMNVRSVSQHMPFGGKTDYSRSNIASQRADSLVEEGLIKDNFPNQKYRVLSLTSEGRKYYERMRGLN